MKKSGLVFVCLSLMCSQWVFASSVIEVSDSDVSSRMVLKVERTRTQGGQVLNETLTRTLAARSWSGLNPGAQETGLALTQGLQCDAYHVCENAKALLQGGTTDPDKRSSCEFDSDKFIRLEDPSSGFFSASGKISFNCVDAKGAIVIVKDLPPLKEDAAAAKLDPRENQETSMPALQGQVIPAVGTNSVASKNGDAK